MLNLKSVFFFFALIGTINLQAQNSKNLLGNWESKDDEGYGKYSIFEHEGKIYGLLYYWKDTKEEFSLEKELEKYADKNWKNWEDLSNEDFLKYMKDFIVLDGFEFKKDKWTGKFIYDEKGSSVKGFLKAQSKDELEVGYSYYGYSDTSKWKRIK